MMCFPLSRNFQYIRTCFADAREMSTALQDCFRLATETAKTMECLPGTAAKVVPDVPGVRPAAQGHARPAIRAQPPSCKLLDQLRRALLSSCLLGHLGPKQVHQSWLGQDQLVGIAGVDILRPWAPELRPAEKAAFLRQAALSEGTASSSAPGDRRPPRRRIGL